MPIFITSASDKLPISVDLLKDHLRILGNDDDTVLKNLYIPSAAEIFTQTTGQALLTTTYKQVFDQFPYENYFLLQRHPFISLSSFKYYDKDNALTDVSTDKYLVCDNTFPASIRLKESQVWPSDSLHTTREGAVEVTYTAGYGANESDVPDTIKQILAMIVGDLFLFREDSIAIPGIAVAKPTWPSYRFMNRYRVHYYEHRSQSRRA